MTKLEELLEWMDDAEYAPSYGELHEKIKQLITEEHQVKNCDLADVVGSEEGTELPASTIPEFGTDEWIDSCEQLFGGMRKSR